jgi:hypothetical protein
MTVPPHREIKDQPRNAAQGRTRSVETNVFNRKEVVGETKAGYGTLCSIEN